jgi:preprotein translocase subunit YajC
MSSGSRSSDLSQAVDGYTRAMTSLLAMPARWATDFATAVERSASSYGRRGCYDPCAPQCNPCDDPCERSCDPCNNPCERSCDPCPDPCAPRCDPCQDSCGCGDPRCSKCGHGSRRLAVGSLVELSGGTVADVMALDDCYVTVKVDSAGTTKRVTKKSICRVLKAPLKVGDKIKTASGIIGRVELIEGRVVTIMSGDLQLQIDRCAICEVLPPPAVAPIHAHGPHP